MRTLLGLLISIRDVGVTTQDIETVRRIRIMNVVAVLASTFSLSYSFFYTIYDAALFKTEIIFVLIMGGSYALVFAATRAGEVQVAMWMLIGIALTHISYITWLLGPGAGTHTYLLTLPFVGSLILRWRDRYAILPVGIAVSLVFFLVAFSDHPRPFDQLGAVERQVFFLLSVLGAVLLACGVSLFMQWLITTAEANLEAEKARGDRLLHAILPESIAEILKADESRVVAQRYVEATVLFADIVGFTKRSANIDAEQIVRGLNDVFSNIDDLATQSAIEKIKTIGDGYFAVAGLPDPVPDHAARMAKFALDLQQSTEAWSQTFWPELQFRVVIHTGPVVAGVIGKSKFSYDVWGDTVNTAARLEEVCEPGAILITETVRSALPKRFQTEEAGLVPLRDKGEISIHRLIGREPINQT